MTPLYRKFALCWLTAVCIHVAWSWCLRPASLLAQDSGGRAHVTINPLGQTVREAASGHAEETGERNVAFWVVSSRGISGVQLNDPNGAINSLAAYMASQSGILKQAKIEDLEETLKHAVGVCLVVHGNRMEMPDAVAFMHGFRRSLGGTDRALVLWSWPSDPETRGLRRDSRLKAVRSEAEGDLLAAWLDRVEPEGQLVLVGYSFGAKTILNAMVAVLSKDADSTETNATNHGSTREIRGSAPVVLLLVAAAAESTELKRVLHLAEDRGVALRVIITVNRRDPALKWYQHLWTCRGPVAIGWVMPCLGQNPPGQQVEFVDVTAEVGHTHRWQAYWCSGSVRRVISDLLSPGEKVEKLAESAQ